MRFIPQTNRTPAIAFVIFLLVSSLIFVGFSFFVSEVESMIMKILGMVLLLFATVVVTRYLSCTYIYVLNEHDFIIIKSTKATETVVCRLDYTTLVDILEYSSIKNDIKKQKLNKINYCSNMICNNPYCLIYDMNGDRGAITFEPSDAFVCELKKRITPDFSLL